MGLISNEINGMLGELLEYDAETQRWTVKLITSRKLAVRARHLVPLRWKGYQALGIACNEPSAEATTLPLQIYDPAFERGV